MNKKNSSLTPGRLLQFIAAGAVYVLFIVFVTLRVSSQNFRLERVLSYRDLLLAGLRHTVLISVSSLVLGLILGFFLYLARESQLFFIRSLASIFIEVMMGTPLLVLVFITSYFIGQAFSFHNDLVLGIVAITAYIGPYMANMFKGAINSIDDQQFIVMDLYGFSPVQRYRYIILPQIFKRMLPQLMNNFSYAIKGSSLLYVTAVTEVFYVVKLIQSKTFAFTEGYLVLWLAYLSLTLPLTALSKYLERRDLS